jgi:hypothetical protein
VPELSSYDYAVIRVVPRVEREEFLNVGIILFAKLAGVLAARVELDEARLAALAPGVDPAAIREHLTSLVRVARGSPDAGPMGRLTQTQRFHWLTAPRSTVIQVSAVHSGLCSDPETELQRLFGQLVSRGRGDAPGD